MPAKQAETSTASLCGRKPSHDSSAETSGKCNRHCTSFTQDLGGSEKKRIKESLYPNDFEWSSKGRIALAMPPQRMVFELWADVAPLAVENFVAIVCGDRGKGSESGLSLIHI